MRCAARRIKAASKKPIIIQRESASGAASAITETSALYGWWSARTLGIGANELVVSWQPYLGHTLAYSGTGIPAPVFWQTASFRPTLKPAILNGQPAVVSISGINEHLIAHAPSLMAANNNWSAIIVGRLDPSYGSDWCLLGYGSSTQTVWAIRGGTAAPGIIAVTIGATTTNLLPVPTGVFVLAIRCSNGALEATMKTATGIQEATATNAGTPGTHCVLGLGQLGETASLRRPWEVSEIALYTRPLNATETARIVNELYADYS